MYKRLSKLLLATMLSYLPIASAEASDIADLDQRKRTTTRLALTRNEPPVTSLAIGAHLFTDAVLAATQPIAQATNTEQTFKLFFIAVQLSRAATLLNADHCAISDFRKTGQWQDLAVASFLIFHTIADAAQATPKSALNLMHRIVENFPILPTALTTYEEFIPPAVPLAIMTAIILGFKLYKDGTFSTVTDYLSSPSRGKNQKVTRSTK